MLYVIILYCTGFCPAEFIGPPSDVLFFSNYADCKAELKEHGPLQMSPNPLPGSPIKTEKRETCARVFADPKQLDRILKSDQLGPALDEYKAHGDGWKPWVPKGCEGKIVCTPNDMVGPCGKGMDFGCLFKPKESPKAVKPMSCSGPICGSSGLPVTKWVTPPCDGPICPVPAVQSAVPLCENALTGELMSCSGEGARNCFDPRSVDPVSCAWAGSVPTNKATVP